MEFLKDVPDSFKLAGSVSAPTMTMFGYSVEQWTFVLSAIVSVMFIIEKWPVFMTRMRALVKWIKQRASKK